MSAQHVRSEGQGREGVGPCSGRPLVASVLQRNVLNETTCNPPLNGVLYSVDDYRTSDTQGCKALERKLAQTNIFDNVGAR